MSHVFKLGITKNNNKKIEEFNDNIMDDFLQLIK